MGTKLSSKINRKKRASPASTKEMLAECFYKHMLRFMCLSDALFVSVIIANAGCSFVIHRNDFSTLGQSWLVKHVMLRLLLTLFNY